MGNRVASKVAAIAITTQAAVLIMLPVMTLGYRSYSLNS